MSKMAGRKRGNILTLTLLIMAVGAIILGLLFQYLGTSLVLAIKSEERAITYYAADSGVEDAVYWLQQYKKPVDYWAWDEGEQLWARDGYDIGDRTVNVNVENTRNDIYKITSTAITDEGKGISIESYVRTLTLDLSTLGNAAITSNNTVAIKAGTTITGNVSVPDGDVWRVDNKGTINGSIVPLAEQWPAAVDISDIFWQDVAKLDPYPDLYIDTAFTSTIGPLYREGDLEIVGSFPKNYTALNGTIYVTGDLDIGKGGASGGVKDFTIDLNGQSIFVEGTLQVYDKCTIVGAGTIIAVEYVKFGPKMSSEEGDYIFIKSVEGITDFLPSGSFCGSVWGHDHVETFANSQVTYVDPRSIGYELPSIDLVEMLTYDIMHY
ncbi:MAG: hypothetical protein RI591_05615 [Dehalococcoidia bacterium]|nr:hypothetical protein [Dehalococcoidia bacterium]